MLGSIMLPTTYVVIYFAPCPEEQAARAIAGLVSTDLHIEQWVTGRSVRRDEQKREGKKGKEKKGLSCSRSAYAATCHCLLAIRKQKEAVALSAEI
jgi:hypothetical protein